MITKNITRHLKLGAVALLLSTGALADTGTLRVSVTDASGNPLAGATVTASTSESLAQKSAVTDSNGEVRLAGLDPSDAYVVTINADGYQPIRNENVLVVSERTFNLPYTLQATSSAAIEEIVTYGRSDLGQLVDTTSALQATDVTLDLTESLPTGRNYQAYLQLAPTTKPTLDGNPSSKSGVNYSDIVDANGNTAGTSSDNVYYIDGINITDNLTGLFGANFNSEIIQEQQIITGGVPAEYEGGQGLVSRVLTKSGSNEFHGSVNYYMQSDSLVADNKHEADATFSTFDTAFTLGGPIIKDKLWFFGSYQRKEREEDVVNPATNTVSRTVKADQDLGFFKMTWQPTENDRVVAEFFNDPYERNGSLNPNVVVNRDLANVQGGDNYKLEYSHAWENLILTANFVSHEGELSNTAADKSSRNDVAYTGAAAVGITNADLQKGGSGSDTITFRNKESFNLIAEYFLDTAYGSHEFKAGYSQVTNEYNRDLVYTGDGAQYTSIGAANTGLTLADYTSGTWTGDRDVSEDDYQRIIDAMAASANSAYFLGLLDADSSGDIDEAELSALAFNSTAGNPTGDFNVYKIEQTVAGPTNFKTEGDVFFIQDSWNIDEHWTVNAGLRAEKWDHIATDGSKVFTFDYDIAPRLSVIYDLKGDGRSKVWGFYGRYYDPIRTDMTSFAGTLTGSVREEQIYVGNQWVTFRTRGGSQGADGFFAPTTKTPYTDEIMVGYEQSITNDQSIAITYTDRVTEDIMEDYDLGFYTDPAQVGGYALPLSYFGFDTLPTANYFIATLAGGKREYQGVEVTWRKRRSADSNWFGLASYSYNDAKGNSNSDGNADLQGDFLYLDPRAPNVYGPQPGNIEHLVKLAGSYRWENGIEVGATYYWNSGTLYSETFSQYSRHTPIRVGTAYEDNGTTTRWLAPGTVGSQKSPSYGTLDVRVKYVMDFADRYEAEFFLDIFNILDDQAVTRQQDLSGGDASYSFGEANDWVLPRRFYLGARMSF
ncbi:TonB-dependent receptor [Woeseia oceani]|uniref:TonB-dependent receptor n=1 Tax=Woeseia oceani TaxID=1548547 RepID=UPI000A5F32B0|nr:TonB-dependent receptor [Woeseia oceani]